MGYKNKETKDIDYQIKIIGNQENEKRIFHLAQCYLLNLFDFI